MSMTSDPEAPQRAPTRADDAPLDVRSPWTTPERLWVLALVGAVALPSIWHLGRPSFWNDEGATWAISGHSASDLVHVLRTSGGDRGAALYYGVIWAWMRAFGTSEFAIRSFSVLAAALTMVPFHACARRLVDRPAAWASGAFLATSALLLIHARDGRTYALATLLVVLAVWTFLRAVETSATRDWWIFTVVAAGAVYAHWFSALVVLAVFLALVFTPPVGEARRRALASGCVLVIATLPIAVLVLSGANSGLDWIAPLNVDELRSLVSGFSNTDSAALQVVLAAVALIGLVTAWSRRRDRRVPPVALTWFVVPVALTILVSSVEPVLVARYLIVALPGFALLLGLGVARIVRGRTLPLVTAVLVLAVLTYHPVWDTGAGAEDWRAIAATIGTRAAPSDAIVVYPSTAVSALSYYARDVRGLGHRAGPTWPPTHWNAPFDRSIPNASVLHEATLARSRVVWLVVRNPGGPLVAERVRRSAVLAGLRRQLHARFASAVTMQPWRTSRTVSVVRYSEPIQP